MSSVSSRADLQDKAQHRDDVWVRKPVLRAVYDDFACRICAACRDGRTLEIGGGSGLLKNLVPGVVSSDVVAMPGLDIVADAQRLPFADASYANIVAIDVLHHIEFPRRFFAEAVRLLRPGGRLVLLEPAVTPASYFFYRFLHEEGLDLSQDPLLDGEPKPNRDPFEANQAIPTLVFGRHRARFERMFPALAIVGRSYLSLFAYPLSGGYRSWSLLPASWAAAVLRWEAQAEPYVGRMLGFRLLAVLERRPG